MSSVSIRPTAEGDLDDLLALWNDGRVMRSVGFPNGLGWDREAMDRWFRKLGASPERHHFLILAEGIGFCGEVYYAVDPGARRASLDVKLRPEAQGRGIATQAFRVLIRHVFENEPGVDAVWTEPWPENRASRALYARCGLAERPRPADLPPGPSYWELRRE